MRSLSLLFSRLNRLSSHSIYTVYIYKYRNIFTKKNQNSPGSWRVWGMPAAGPWLGKGTQSGDTARERQEWQAVQPVSGSSSRASAVPLSSRPSPHSCPFPRRMCGSRPSAPAPQRRSSAAALLTCGRHALGVPGERSPRSPAPSPPSPPPHLPRSPSPQPL